MTTGSTVWLDAKHLSRPEWLSRLTLARGTQAATAAHSCPGMFETAARVARAPWQPVTERALAESGIGLGRHRDSDSVAVVELPADLMARLLAARALSLVPLRRAEADGLRDAALTRWAGALQARHGWRFDPATCGHVGFGIGPGNMPNTTTHPESGQLIGLHLDSWDRLPPLRRHQGHNRICLNLGPGDRSLQFVPCQAADIVGMLKSAGRDVLSDRDALRDSSGRLDLARVFLETCPDVPVLRMRMRPGEAYIAPTENLIHDGCAESPSADLTLTLRGRIEALP